MPLPSITRITGLCVLTVLPAVTLAAGPKNPFLDLSIDQLVDVALIGKGEARQVQSISQDDLRLLLPGTSPFKAIEKLPGVHFVSADAAGNYEWSMRLGIRGFRQNQLGFTLDDVPLGDMDYHANNGLAISRALIAENLEGVELAQGSGAVATASSSNLGGTLRFSSSAPSTTPGLRFAQTLGSSSGSRSFLKADLGQRGRWNGYLALVRAETDKWKGFGQQEHDQLNGKLVYDFGLHQLRGFYSASRRREADYMDLSRSSQQRLGWDWDYYAPDWQRALDAVNGIFTGGVTSIDDAYFSGRGLRDDDLASLTLDLATSEASHLKTTAYHHHNDGQGHWYTPYNASRNGLPISIRTTEYLIDRAGLLSALTTRFGAHELQAGVWHEDTTHRVSRNFYDVDGPRTIDDFLRDPARRVYSQQMDTRTLQVHVRDRISLREDRLQLDLGAKSLRVESRARTLIGGGNRASGELQARDAFLPQLGVRYRLRDRPLELFGSYAENLATFSAGRDGPFSATQAAFDATVANLQPESSQTLEAGLRYSSETVVASVAAYRVTFNNRLLNIAQCVGIIGCANSFANVGTVNTRGIELTSRWQPSTRLSWLNSLSFNDSTYADDYLDGATVVPTAGKHVVDSPRRLFASELIFREGRWDARLAAKFTDRRFYSYLNDASVPAFWLLDAGIGYALPSASWLKASRLQLNVTNLLDERYFSTLGSNGFRTRDTAGQHYTLLAGAPRQVFLSLELQF